MGPAEVLQPTVEWSVACADTHCCNNTSSSPQMHSHRGTVGTLPQLFGTLPQLEASWTAAAFPATFCCMVHNELS